ncbi:TPA: glucosyltransferase domain-containing protein, partial [Enterobacter hormaechei subsp. steigerwaltii]|nr:glucosyltransferase domain-containing protein [Enterobacter hormaechei subsp. steigerwaltii]
MVSFHKKEFSLFSAWIFSLIIISIGYYPLINDRLYLVDDITRSIKGYFGWIELGRPLTEWLAMFLSTSSDRLADITPLPQLSSIVALSYLTILLLKNTFHKITIGNVLICITVAVNPLLLGNMLFRFDSLSMI